MAFAITVFLHVGIVVFLPERIFLSSLPKYSDEPLTVEIDLTDPLTPEQLKFVEANPDVPENEPDRKDQYSFRNQQAADYVPHEDLSNVPYVEGEESSQKILQGDPLRTSPLPPGVYSSQAKPGKGEGVGDGKSTPINDALWAPSKPLPPPDFLEQEPITEDGPGSHADLKGKAKELFEQIDPNAPLDVYQQPSMTDVSPSQLADDGGGSPEAKPMPRARPRLSPELLHGPLISSTGSASRTGRLAIDATFNQFGEYEQQFYAAVQVGWYREIDFFQPIDTSARVAIRFTMHSDGTIQDVESTETTASKMATLICENAIIKRSPFRPWTKEMVEIFGKARTLQVVFHYR